MKKMIDLHMHVIPDVDDGSKSLEISEQMLHWAAEQGVETVFATSHSLIYEECTSYGRSQYRKLQKMIREEGLPIKVYFGCELLLDVRYINQILDDLDSGRIPSLNGTRYVLTELFNGLGEDKTYYVNKLIENGWIPVIAHAERLDDLSVENLQELKEAGCLIQINLDSILDEKHDRRKRVLELLDNKMVDFCGSDAHGMDDRLAAVDKGILYLYEHFEEKYVDDILYNNAVNLILKETVVEEELESNPWIDGMMGLIMGDALGMPVQFLRREDVKEAPIFNMDGFGTYDMPAGTWSDDGSMAFATLNSIYEKKGIDYDDMMRRFVNWTVKGEYTPAGRAFDQGNTCMYAIVNYMRGMNYKTCGKTGEHANGNGALMRIMPVCLYAYMQHKNGNISLEEAIEIVHQATALTHNHLRAKMASGIYFFMVQAILEEEGTLRQRLQQGMDQAKKFYKSDWKNRTEWLKFKRMEKLDKFAALEEGKIKSTGYVLDSLEAAVWSLITTESLEEGLLKAVNLGYDTDSVGAIAGGLAALYYGYKKIPYSWRKVIIRGEEIITLCKKVFEYDENGENS